jgi:hypothetical protein
MSSEGNAPTKERKIAIVGTAPSSRSLAPLHDPTWEIWACSPGNQNLGRVDRWYEIHAIDADWSECTTERKIEWIEWLRDKPNIVMAEKYPGFPGSRAYPIDKLTAEFGPWFFTSTPSMMMAEAIYEGATTIGVFGIDLAQADEYACERPGFQFWIQEAQKRGIQVVVPAESDVAEPTPVYGISLGSRMSRKILARRSELQGRIQNLSHTINTCTQEKTLLEGALQNLDWVHKTWAR